MAATMTVTEAHAGNGYLLRSGTGNLGVYATSGVAITARQLGGLGIIDVYDPEPSGLYSFQWDKTNGKVLAYTDDVVTGISAEVANAVDLTAVVFQWSARGAY